MNFAESTKYLFSLGNEVSAMKLGLENIRRLLSALDNPQNNYLKIQVAGTNGKGSVCAFLGSILDCAGIETGICTSPHLISITERVRIGGAEIDEDELARLATTVRDMADVLLASGDLEYLPTFFEQMTAIALLAFAEAGVEIAILETGLGGRLDATTAANSEFAVITQIALDHQEYLGTTLEEIAAEKAAVIRPDSSVIVARQDPLAERVIRDRCIEMGVEPVWATTEIRTVKQDEEFLSSTFITLTSSYPAIELGIEGRHQIANAAAAIAAAEMLCSRGSKISQDDISLGLEMAEHPGRLEYFDRYLLDGAHNIAGVTALCAYLDEFVSDGVTIIFGAMKGKDVGEMAELLCSRAGTLIVTQPDNSRTMTAEEVAAHIPDTFDRSKLVLTASADEAMAAADDICGDELILVTGSLYLVGEVKKILNN